MRVVKVAIYALLAATYLSLIVGAIVWLATFDDGDASYAYQDHCLPEQKDWRNQESLKIRILERDWVSHGIVAHIAAILLREELRYDVEVVSKSTLPAEAQSPAQDYESVAAGLFDANLEVWPDGKENEHQQWVSQDGKGAIHIGDHQVLSYYGMYVPLYDGDSSSHFFTMFKDEQTLRDYDTIRLARGEAAGDSGEVCGRPEWGCNADLVWRPSHCAAAGPGACETKLLRGQSEYHEGLLEQRIEANGLNLSAVYTTMGTLAEQVWQGYANKRNFIFYNWEPNSPMLALDSTRFKRVKFMPKREGSTSCHQANTTPMGGNACDDPAVLLQKIISKPLSKSRDAAHFLRMFQLTKDDYHTMFEEYEGSKGNPYTAACRWLIRAGPGRYEKWTKHTYFIPFEETIARGLDGRGCWGWFWIQLALLFVTIFTPRCVRLARAGGGNSGDSKDCGDKAQRAWSRLGERITKCVFGDKFVPHEFANIVKSRTFGFLSFRREVLNFVSADGIFSIPEKGQSHFRMNMGSGAGLNFVSYMIGSEMKHMLTRSLQFSLAVGMLGTLVHMYMENTKGVASVSGEEVTPMTDMVGTNMAKVVTDLSLLALFLLVLKVNASSGRWSTRLGLAGSIQGRLGDLALIIGSLQGANDGDKVEAKRVRKLQFEFYRYLNATHCLAYFQVDQRLPQDAMGLCNELKGTGLLVEGEPQRLVSAVRGDMHVTMLAWLAALWQQEVDDRESVHPHHPNSHNFMDKLEDLRTSIASLRGTNDYEREPDITNAMLVLVTYLLFTLVFLAYPCNFYNSGSGCTQYWTMLSGLSFFFMCDGLLTMHRLLSKSPFDPEGDPVNVDWLLSGSEEVLWYMIRASWADESADKHAPESMLFADSVRGVPLDPDGGEHVSV